MVSYRRLFFHITWLVPEIKKHGRAVLFRLMAVTKNERSESG